MIVSVATLSDLGLTFSRTNVNPISSLHFINIRYIAYSLVRRCEKEEDLAMIAAQQYYIEYGTDINAERLYGLLPNYIPDYCVQTDNALDTWNGLILQAYKKVRSKRRGEIIILILG